MLKKLDKYFLDIKPLFDKGGKFERWYPLYEATDSFLFSTTKSAPIAPHSRDAIDYKRIMITVIIALIPCTVMALWNTGYQANSALADLGAVPDGWRGAVMQIIGINPSSLISNMMHGALYFMPIYIVTVVVGSIWETLFNLLRGHEFSEAFLVTSLLLPLTLPPTIPLWQVAVGVSFGVVLAKEVFGGVGRNFMNPALSSRAFIYFAYPAQMSGDSIWTAVDGLSSATPLTAMVSSSAPNPISQIDVSWGNAFLGVMPGSMGETSTLACLFGAGLLLITGVASWRIMAAMLLGAVVTTLLFNTMADASHPLYSIPIHWHLVLGGFAFGLVFMATDPVSAAHTKTGQWMYGLLIGFIVILIRVANPAYPEGVMLAILLGNVFAPLFDYFVLRANVRRRVLRHG
ncbi:MAG: NADH:ubiquinone reductase (Na(+)-transporting) subunit B [Desulfofustis sp. PB-SRB1]|jgi:Na+-transporting NADH:ubiquinone oxidoreductase subunit B|nr:NADH:ubiquinone reductase (Na(+)-transporting) subunit B [Desulfofustis sp. PB-SRB1]MBM1003267.1 NADH:ubiquinone reductase (Na(+)-transporting) subunit B [Desulfofustis sp. PB-SRB1]HBH28615.1 NADH:ubiquinone reductase (Na(+)-transporting) subunit B [Desulfofustis sp.]